ncbi:MAG: Fic family protein [Crocinitomicaceae bacterium]|jgi:Fic family protein
MISAVEEMAYDTIRLVNDIKKEMMTMKNILPNNYKFYSQELLNHLFKQPYTKIGFLQKDLGVSRVTASGYLNTLAKDKVIIKYKLGKTNYYINIAMMGVLSSEEKRG